MDELLTKFGLKYEELTPLEKETLHSMVNAAQQNILSVEKIKDNIQACKYSVEQELSNTPSNLFTWLFGWKRDFGLKARLRNYMLLEAVLTSPERAKKALEQTLSQVRK